jgi:hypothetical protein
MRLAKSSEKKQKIYSVVPIRCVARSHQHKAAQHTIMEQVATAETERTSRI